MDAELLFTHGEKKNILFYPGTVFLTTEMILGSWTEILTLPVHYKAGINMLENDLVLIVLFPRGSISQTNATPTHGLHLSDCVQV